MDPKTAYRLFKEKYETYPVAFLVDYSDYYVVEKRQPLGDTDHEAYKIDKINGTITDFSFLEYVEVIKHFNDINPPIYFREDLEK